jgi:regulator of RNase E activity RraA
MKREVKISQEILTQLKAFPCTNILDVLRSHGYLKVYMEGVRSLIPGTRLVGRAVTLRFLPQRPDLQEEMVGKENTPEYRAIELCGPGDVLVMDAMGLPYASVGGDIKFLRLKLRKAEGIVTDGALRDTASLKTYGLGLFAQNSTAKAGPTDILPYEENVAIQCGGVLVLPGDVIVGDDDGVVVIPQHLVPTVVQEAAEKEELEQFIKERLTAEDVSPGKYYPPRESTQKLFEEWNKRK